MNQSSFLNWIFCREQNEVMSNVRAVPRRPGTPGSPLDTVKKLNANPLLCYCMHAGSAASPQQGSHVQQHNTKTLTQWLALKAWQTASSRTLDEVLKPLKYLQRRVLLLLCWVIEGGELRDGPPCPTDSLSGFLVREEVTRKQQLGMAKKKEIKTKTVCLANIRPWVHTGCSRSEEMRGRVWGLRILIREELESGTIHHLLGADNNTSAASCRRQTVFVKHVRVTEQQRVRRTVD